MEEQTQYKAEKIGGILTICAGLVWIVIQLTSSRTINDITQVTASLTAIIENTHLFIINVAGKFVLIIVLVGISAIYYLMLRTYRNILGHFISFGMLATAMAFIVALAADLSTFGLINEYQVTTGMEQEMLAINILSMLQFEMKALIIGKTLFALSLLFLFVFLVSTRLFNMIYTVFLSFTGVMLLYTTWLIPSSITDIIVNLATSTLYIIAGILFYNHSKIIRKEHL